MLEVLTKARSMPLVFLLHQQPAQRSKLLSRTMTNDTTTASSAKTEPQMDEDVKQCTICYSAPRSIRFRPCGHWTVCEDCALSMIAHSKDHLLACPSCKTSIAGICLEVAIPCLLYTSPSPRDGLLSRMPSSA